MHERPQVISGNDIPGVMLSSAVRGYVNKRLGWDHSGNAVSGQIGPGALAQDGSTSMSGNLPAGGFKITNLSDPSSNQDAATKSYVDGLITAGDTIPENIDVETKNIGGNQLFLTTGLYRMYTVPATGGNFIAGAVITGSNTGATGTLVEVKNVTRNAVAENLLIYTATSGVFTLADIVGASSNTITGQAKTLPVSYTHLTLPTNREV